MKPDEVPADKRSAKQKWRRRPLLWGLCAAIVLLVVTAIVSWWTMIRMPGESYRSELPSADNELMRLGGELRRDVAQLSVEIGERNVYNRPEALQQAADYIDGQFVAAGYEVRRQTYRVSDCDCHNLAVEIRGTSEPESIVVIGAHYDTVHGVPGANDNTSGVAAVLALARRYSDRRASRTLRFVAFVNEEPPYFQTRKMGSWVYARDCRQKGENVVAMLSLETIGYYTNRPGSQRYPAPLASLYPSQGNFIAIVGDTGSRDLVRWVVATFRGHEQFPCEGGALPSSLPGVGFSDHWSFWQEGYPAVMVTDTAMFRYPYYHHPEDTIDKIDFHRTARVVRGLDHVIAELAGAEPADES